MALVSGGRSTLNPNAPLFIPSHVRQVEDFSPEWWNLVTTATWFRDYWMSQQQGEEYGDDEFGFVGNNVADLLPENIDLDVDVDILNMEAQFEEFLQSSSVTGFPRNDREALVRTLSLTKERESYSTQPPKYYEKPGMIAASPKYSAQQPRWM